MTVSTSSQGPIVALSVRGPIIEGECDALTSEVDDRIDAGDLKFLLNFSEVPYVDSVGLDTILELVTTVGKRGGSVRISSPTDVCNDIFRATGVDGFVQVYDSDESAAKSLL